MSAWTLPEGVDILASYQAQMARHQFGRFQQVPEADFQLFAALVSRASALAQAVAGLDGKPAGEFAPLAADAAWLASYPMPVDPHRRPELHLGDAAIWPVLGHLVAGMLAIEGRLGALDHGNPTRDDAGLFAKIAGQIRVDGFVHRVEENFYEALRTLIYRIPEGEARASPLVPAKKAS